MKARPPETSRLLRSARPLLALALFTLLVYDVFGAHGFLAMRGTQKEIERLRQEIAQFNTENRDLSEQVKALRSDPRLIERIAREEMGLARPGELIFKLAPPAKQDPPKK